MKTLLSILLVSVLSLWAQSQAKNNITKNLVLKNDSLLNIMLEEVNTSAIESYIFDLQDFDTRFLIAPNRKQIAEWIRDKFISLGMEIVRIDSFYCATTVNIMNLNIDTSTVQYNVIATLTGLENPDQYYVIGAHYDNIVAPYGDPMIFSPGADDNASGCAALFEIVRLMKLYNYQPAKSIDFVAFSAEELMHFGDAGSVAYIEAALANNSEILYMINNDMIANTNSTDWTIDISNYIGSEWLTDMALYVTETYSVMNIQLQPLSTMVPGDCKPFFEAGIPCVFFMEKDFNSNYHSEYDIIENCEIYYCAEAIKISLALLFHLDNPITILKKNHLDNNFRIYPNPANNWININLSDNLNLESTYLELWSSSGHLLIKKKIENKISMIDLESISSGIYTIQIYDQSSINTAKLVVK